MTSTLYSIYLEEQRSDTVTTFHYVGNLLRYDRDNEPEIKKRIASAKQALHALRNLTET